MTYLEILAQLNALPNTYVRPGSSFAALQSSRAASLFRYANAVDGLIDQLQFSNASGVWLDVWGKLFGIPRNLQESDGNYAARISATLVAGRATPVAMILYLKIALGLTATITEDFVKTAWQLHFNTPLSSTQFNQLMSNLAYVRPAGVPSLAAFGSPGGTFAGTVNYLRAPRITGAYLESGGTGLSLDVASTTNNSKPLLPTTYLSDPSLNPILGAV